MIWQLLIPHMPHRHDKLVGLLDVLAAQMRPGVEVLIYSDNLEASYTEKLQLLADMATADYTSHLANDDSVASDFIPRVLDALDSEPDYVGFWVRYTLDGERQQPCLHSLACDGWTDTAAQLNRDLMYYNPIRRDLADQVRFRGQFCDIEWGDDLRALGIVRTEVFIDAEMLYYQRDTSDYFHTHREPMPEHLIPELPRYPFVRCVP